MGYELLALVHHLLVFWPQNEGLNMWRTQIKNLLSGPGSDREKIRILSKQLYLGTDDRLHFASFRASDSSFEGTVVTGLVDLVE